MKNESAVRFTTIVLVLAGVGAVFLAWNGAASHDHVPAQLPYLVSGGLGGLILTGAGLVLLRNFEARRDARRLESRLEALREAVDRLAAEQQAPRPTSPAPPAPAAGGSAGGTAQPLSAADHVTVVAGPSTYHREDCHLVANRAAPTTSRAAARQRNLSPCRVCNPDSPAGDGAGSSGEWEPAR